MKTLEQIKQILKQLKPELESKFHVNEIGIFGSYVFQNQSEESDIDILVAFSKTPTLFEYVRAMNYLSEKLEKKVDLVMKTSLKPNIGKRILKEVVYI